MTILNEDGAFKVIGTFGKLLELAYDNVISVEIRASMKDGDMSFYYRTKFSPHITMGNSERKEKKNE